MNNLFKALLIVAAVVLAWMSYDSITTPIEFNKIRFERELQVVSRLVDIRTAETEYRNLNGDYTASLDTLINWIKTTDAKIVLKEGVLTDKQLEEGMTEKEAVKLGLIKRDTTYVPMVESLYGKGYPVDSLRYIPFSNGQQFELAKAEGVNAKVMIGGAVITQDYCDEINADGYGKDASEAVKVATRLLGLMS